MSDTLSPVWNEEFVWESVQRSDHLDIDVWARGTLHDTFLCRFQSSIEKAIKQEGTLPDVDGPVHSVTCLSF